MSRTRLRFDHRTFRFSVVDGKGHEREGVSLVCPSAGYGGHEIVRSPDGSYAALFLFSGQSEQGWELFSLTPSLRRLPGLPYVFGMGDPPLFSPDSSHLVMVCGGDIRFTDSRGTLHREVELDEELRRSRSWVMEYAQLWVQRLPRGKARRHRLCVKIPRACEEDPFEWESPGNLQFTAADRLRMKLPWGKVEAEFPPPARIIYSLDG